MTWSFRHIGINAVFLQPRFGGLETQTRAIVPELMRLAPGVRFSVFLNPSGREVLETEDWSSEVTLVTHPLLGRRGLRAASELTILGELAPRRGVDTLYNVALTAPLRTRAVNVVVLADITWIVAPDPAVGATMRLWRTIVPPVARRADRVIAISSDGAADIVEHLGVPRSRIDVVYPGQAQGERVTPTPDAALRERLALGDGPLVLSVSQKRPHKNLLRLVSAMAGVRRRAPGAVLVLPGNPTAHEQELREHASALGLGHAVAFLDYVDAADLEGLYAAASCFAIASINEGFGIPILEAQRRGLPVACSNASALPEAAGPAARYFDPYDEADIARAIGDILTDPALAARLVAEGLEHQATFTWERAAAQTLESFERGWVARRR
ncbi:MAG: glycosyltransferase family 1 protein [Solirubrobacteraceae bacterium]